MVVLHMFLPSAQSLLLSKKLGSFLNFPSNFLHQSSKAFNGTTSMPAVPVPPGTGIFPLKLARKLKALLIIFCASCKVFGCCDRVTSAVEGSLVMGIVRAAERDAICAATEDEDSIDIPSIISRYCVSDEDPSGASISTSPFTLAVVLVPLVAALILNIALSLPGPMPPRNLKFGPEVEEEALGVVR